MSIIFRPELPPRAGYVEVVDETGKHIYKPTPETAALLQKEQKQQKTTGDIQQTLSTLLDTTEDEPAAAIEFRKAVQLFATTLTDEAQIMQIATVYPEYQVGVSYQIRDIFRYGTNEVGDPQLYQVLQAHTSAAEWKPDASPSLYKAIGVTEEGIPEWVQPIGATDAYNTGDIVMYNGQKYKSLIDANVWSPDAYPAGWELVTD